MTYSLDLRKRVVDFVLQGGSKVSASRHFSVSVWCVNDWCSRATLEPKAHGRRQRKLDWQAVKKYVEEHPDAVLREIASHFSVHKNAIWYATQKMKLTHKKNILLRRKKP